jgi:hypothetical protein
VEADEIEVDDDAKSRSTINPTTIETRRFRATKRLR